MVLSSKRSAMKRSGNVTLPHAVARVTSDSIALGTLVVVSISVVSVLPKFTIVSKLLAARIDLWPAALVT